MIDNEKSLQIRSLRAKGKMDFAHPVFLVLLLAVPPLLWRWRRGRPALRFSDVGLLANLPPGRSRAALRGGLWLRALGMVSLILALAGPRWPDAGTRLPTDGIAIAMVVDVSASMKERDFLWQEQALSRLEGVQQVFRLFVSGGAAPDGEKLSARDQDLISLVTFATRPDTACPLTLDHAALLKILDAEKPRELVTEATTNPGDAIAWALLSLQKAAPKRKVLIFLTDGESNVPAPALTPRQAAQLAGNLAIPIYAIGAGPDFGDAATEDNAKARKSMEDVAQISGGRFFQATDGKALAQACAKIDELERTQVKSFQYLRYHEGFAWLAGLSLLSLFSVLGMESTRWRRVPA
jgi:Ca-activated chloride channel family protein